MTTMWQVAAPPALIARRYSEPRPGILGRNYLMRSLKFILVSLMLFVFASIALAAARSDVADAVMRGDKAAVRVLLQQKADVNAPQSDGATALHWAVYHNDLETVDVLIRAGAKPDVKNREGVTR